MRFLYAANTGLNLQHQPCWVFQQFFQPHQEADRLLAVDQAMIIAERDIHHRPDLDLVAHGHRALLDGVHAQDAALWRVEDGG